MFNEERIHSGPTHLLPSRRRTRRLLSTQCELSGLIDEPGFSERLARKQVRVGGGEAGADPTSHTLYTVRYSMCAWDLKKDARISWEAGAFLQVQ